MCTLIYQTISFIASTVSKQITRNHFGLSFKADSDRTVFRVLTKMPSGVMMIHFASFLSVLLLLTSEAQKADCDLKDAECLDLLIQTLCIFEVFFSCALTLAWQHIHAGVGGVATVATIPIIHIMVPPPSPRRSQFALPNCLPTRLLIFLDTPVLLRADAGRAAGCCVGESVDLWTTFR